MSIDPLEGIDAPEAVALLEMMLRIRRFEEHCVELYSAAKIRGFLHLYVGEEAVAAGIAAHLRPDDAVVATYRDHGHAIAKGVGMRAVMAEMFAKVTGCSRGRGGSMHLFDAATRFYGGNAIVGGGLPVAAGLALAEQWNGTDAVAVCCFGEGAVAEGEWHETMNLASLWNLPVLFACENNLYAMGTALARSEAEVDLVAKANSYGMTAWSVDGMDVAAVRAATGRALTSMRAGGGPVFLELRTYRFRAHSMYDPDRYRDKSEIESWKQRDPITHWRALLEERGILGEGAFDEMDRAVEAEVDDAIAFAEESELEPVSELTRWVYSDGSTAVASASAAPVKGGAL
ncbi:MAG: pyruvate dehydrogenase (acetyl-transferring) E1 component subunit alpha [Microthrixaceae bacterium]|nr:pyruvate dehydrogenase (acetyl-transferring) E1 component subunit alpha [Microthrixaceae bacterium]